MKKYIAFFTCLLAVLACGKENKTGSDDINLVRPTISVSSENPVTMATFSAADGNNDCSLLWSAGDKIGVHIYSGTSVGRDNGGYNRSWTLDPADAGQTSGSFTCDEAIDGSHNYSYAAYYPFDTHNIGGDAMFYCAYKNEYNGYVPGTVIAPMVANMNADAGGLDRKSTDISLKHVGALVKITLNGVPAEANKLVLTINNNNITGWAGVNPAEAGTASVSPSDLSDGTGITVSHSVTLNFANGSETRNGLVFYFPVPVLTTPAIQLDLYGYDNVHIWTKSAANPQSSVGRGEILAMQELTVAPLRVYVLDSNAQGWGEARNLYVYKGDTPYGRTWPGIYAATKETFSGHSYYKFLLPVEANGQECDLIFNKGTSGYQVNLPKATISSTPLYYRTNGIDVITVADPASPGALSTAKRIWAWSPDATSIGIHTFGGTAAATSWDAVRSMTKSTAQHAGTYWFYYDVPGIDQDMTTEMVLRIGYDGNAYSNQTRNISLITLNLSYYYTTGGADGEGKYYWTQNNW